MNLRNNLNQNLISFQYQPFHMVTNSPWPIMTSFSLLILTVSAVLYFNDYYNVINNQIFLFIGFITTIFSMILWFSDIITEATYLGDHTKIVQNGIMIGFVLFVVSEIFFFISIFWAFFHSSLSPNIEIGSQWPPLGIDIINPFDMPFLNTMILLSSGAAITYSHHSLIQGNRYNTIFSLILTIIFACIFTICQGIEYINSPFSISDGIYGSIFYFSTGFHGIHVMIGCIFIMVSFISILNYHLSDQHHLGFESSILYWHFVDVVWLFLFISIYWWT